MESTAVCNTVYVSEISQVFRAGLSSLRCPTFIHEVYHRGYFVMSLVNQRSIELFFRLLVQTKSAKCRVHYMTNLISG